ncbi:MAG: hypothetical protein EOP80_15555 [Variovorax sp.]|jgi:type II secretory pathway pseudopilin PulG|nr:MAG: hypothetical protein EOP80_15555 [Variovorax sp.]
MEIGALAIVIAVVSGLISFLIGRWLSRGRRERKASKARAAAEATQSRQVRRARERRGQR